MRQQYIIYFMLILNRMGQTKKFATNFNSAKTSMRIPFFDVEHSGSDIRMNNTRNKIKNTINCIHV